jgi:Na+/pantothenate symporter
MPDIGKSDEVIPRMALHVTKDFSGGSLLAGLILSAPFGAIMATVSGYLVVIASGLVRDIYQRFVNPEANEYVIRRLSYLVMIGIGVIAVALNLRPVPYLQVLVVFSGTGAAASFVVPALMLPGPGHWCGRQLSAVLFARARPAALVARSVAAGRCECLAGDAGDRAAPGRPTF